jgi:siderophore synthetase component
MLPPLLQNGVAFEAHAQNLLLRIDVKTMVPLGFVVRDLGGLRVHPPTLKNSIGRAFHFLEGHCVVTKSTQEAYSKMYHTLIHNHLQRLIRLLGMHYNGKGWQILRHHLKAIIPATHELYREWLGPDSKEVSGKCLMRMRIQDVYSEVSDTCLEHSLHV